MSWAFFIIGWLAGLLILGLIARLLAALFSEKSRNLMKSSPKRHLIWIFTAVALWIFLSEFSEYMAHKSRVESKRKFIEKMQHDLKSDSRFADVAIDTNHLRFISITGTVSSTEEKLALQQLIHTNQHIYFSLASEDTTVKTNFNK